MQPYKVVEDFEQALCDYTGAPYAVTTTSCTMAILLALKALPMDVPASVEVPRRTYVGVPMSVINAGHKVWFVDMEWKGFYKLEPFPIWDSARYFTRDLFNIITCDEYGMVCLSFHASKTLGLEQGGAILHNLGPSIDETLRRLRFDGRAPGVAVTDDQICTIGYHCPMIPSVAAEGLLKLSVMADKDYPPLPNDDYPDLSFMPAFRSAKKDNARLGSKLDAATDWLSNYLATGPKSAVDVTEKAKTFGITIKTLQRARLALGVVSSKAAGQGRTSGWEWSLPTDVLGGSK